MYSWLLPASCHEVSVSVYRCVISRPALNVPQLGDFHVCTSGSQDPIFLRVVDLFLSLIVVSSYIDKYEYYSVVLCFHAAFYPVACYQFIDRLWPA